MNKFGLAERKAVRMAGKTAANDIVPKTEDIEAKTEEEEDPNSIDTLLKNTEAQLVEIRKTITQLQQNVRLVKKGMFVLRKIASRPPRRKRSETQNKASGFAAASELSSELKMFMGLAETDMRSRTEVTKWLCSYIQEHKLQAEQDRRYILFETDCGKKLRDLLQCEKDRITYFDLQHYLKHHISSKNNPMTKVDESTVVQSVDVTSAVTEPSPTTETKRKTAVRPRPVPVG